MTVGIDAKLVKTQDGLFDLQIGTDGDVVTEDSLDAAIIVSVLTDRRADSSEVKPAHLRRGWIGNEETPGFEIGSKLWLYEQARVTRSVLNGVSDAAKDALQWLVEDGVAISVREPVVGVTQTGLDLTVTVEKPNSEAQSEFFALWKNTGA